MNPPVVGVVGAGTMGQGIAQVAATAGHRVLVHDSRPDAAVQACVNILEGLNRRVVDGKLSQEKANAIVERIAPASLSDLSTAKLVIEAIVEELEAKQSLFAALETIVDDDCCLASNTSSLSITAIARGLRRPDRFIGLHFFNPAPIMKLIEVVPGLATDPAVTDRLTALARTWDKSPAKASNTPGFIVNRIARPFYAEALALVEHQYAEPAQIDEAMRGAGFRMGPCELMDLIGHDVNYSVTQSVFAANFGDRRYLPSRVQRELVDGRRLGRKSGQGFYRYPENPPTAASEPAVRAEGLRCIVRGTDVLAAPLTSRIPAPVHLEECDTRSAWQLDVARDDVAITLCLSDGRPAAQVAAERGTAALAVVDWPMRMEAPVAIAFAPRCPPAARDVAREMLACMGIRPIEIGDAPGLCVARTLSMLVNEAADAVQQGVCDEATANLAMRLATNWPAGPFEWLAQLGVARVVNVLDHIHRVTRSERYRVSPNLLTRYWCMETSQ